MAIGTYLEAGLAKLLSGVRGHDSGLVTRGPGFDGTSAPQQSIVVSVPEIGPSGDAMDVRYSQHAAGGEKFPTIQWEAPDGVERPVAEYALVIEDPDVPIPRLCLAHAIFYGIPAGTTQVTADDVAEAVNDKKTQQFTTKAGWRFVPNLRGKAYVGPKPPVGHGAHRYFFTVLALSDKIDSKLVSEGGISKASFVKAISGKVLAWGEWVGTFESQWEN